MAHLVSSCCKSLDIVSADDSHSVLVLCLLIWVSVVGIHRHMTRNLSLMEWAADQPDFSLVFQDFLGGNQPQTCLYLDLLEACSQHQGQTLGRNMEELDHTDGLVSVVQVACKVHTKEEVAYSYHCLVVLEASSPYFHDVMESFCPHLCHYLETFDGFEGHSLSPCFYSDTSAAVTCHSGFLDSELSLGHTDHQACLCCHGKS